MKNERLIQKLLALLKERGYTQRSFEARMRWPENRISKWASQGQGEPTASQVWLMAKELDVPVEYLLDDEQDQPERPRLSKAQVRMLMEIVEQIGWGEMMARLLKPMSVPRDETADKIGDKFGGRAIRRGRPVVEVERDSEDVVPDKGRTPKR
jgi:transcriptional regulator with XRE-family HTH domain